jgi:amino acid permease
VKEECFLTFKESEFISIKVDNSFFPGGLAAAVPQLHNVISLVGALTMSLLGFVFPVAIHSITFYNDLSWIVHAKNVAIFVFGILGCLAGTYTAVYNIIKTLQKS